MPFDEWALQGLHCYTNSKQANHDNRQEVTHAWYLPLLKLGRGTPANNPSTLLSHMPRYPGFRILLYFWRNDSDLLLDNTWANFEPRHLKALGFKKHFLVEAVTSVTCPLYLKHWPSYLLRRCKNKIFIGSVVFLCSK